MAVGIVLQSAEVLSVGMLGGVVAAALACLGYGLRGRNWGWCAVGTALFFLWVGGVRCIWMQDHESTLSGYLVGGSGQYAVTVITKGEKIGSEDNLAIRYGVRLQQVMYEDGTSMPARGNAYWYAKNSEPMYAIGDQLTLTGRIVAFRYYRNPGNILLEYRRRAQGYLGNLYTDSSQKAIYRGTDETYHWDRYISSAHEKVSSFLHAKMASKEVANLADSLLFGGNYNQLSPQVVSDFATTGMIHILSVSGSHISLLFGVLMGLGGWIGLSQKRIFFFAVAIVGFYAALAGWVPPVVRSFAMGTAALGAMVWRREYTATHWLGLTVIGMLLYQPYYVYDVSFQLSVGAATGILLFASPIYRQLKKHIPNYLALTTAVAVSAQILLIPLLLYYFHVLPTYTVISNMTVGTLLELAIIICLGAVLGQIVPFVGDFLAWAGSQIITLAVTVNQWIAHWPGANWYGRGWEWPEIVAYYALIVGVCVALQETENRRRIWYGVSACCVSFLLVYSWSGHSAALRLVVPDLGSARGIVIEHAGGSLVYYREGEWVKSRLREKSEWISALEYFGVYRPSIWIQDDEVKMPTRNLLMGTPIYPEKLISHTFDKNALQDNIGQCWRWSDGWTAEYRADGLVVRDAENVTVLVIPWGNQSAEIPMGEHTCLVFSNARQMETYRRDAGKGNYPAAVVLPPLQKKFAVLEDTVFAWLNIAQYNPSEKGCVVGTYRNGKWSMVTYE